MKPDERLRARLRELADAESLPELSAARRLGAESRARAELERSERRRTWGLALFACGALAVAALLMLELPSRSQQAQVAVRPSQGSPPPHGVDTRSAAHVGSSLPSAPAQSPSCSAHAAARWTHVPNGLELDLGARALLRASPEALVTHSLSDDCDVQAGLERGALAVHARHLGGRTLVVHTPRGDVTVKGTIFEVALSASGELSVGVDEGLVEVRPPDAAAVLVEPGIRVSLGTRMTREPFAHSERTALRRQLGLDVLVPSTGQALPMPQVQPNAPDAAAEEPTVERSWHAGSVEPPRVAPEPGSSVTEEGRPMSKPRVVHEKGGHP
ncbi:MAG: FecR domain-containing protein [Myxococcales bacterium]